MNVPPAPGYFEAVGPGRYRPTRHAGGAWADDELHMAPVSGVIVDALEHFLAGRPGNGLVISRITFDILGKIPAAELEVQVRVVRPGRTIELLEATASAAGRPVVTARAWLLVDTDTTEVAGGSDPRLPDPAALVAEPFTTHWSGGFVESVLVRPCAPSQPGRATVWLSTTVPLLTDRPVSDLARFVALVDTANGVAIRESPRAWMFPNVDLTIHLHRRPTGPWVGLDTTVTFGAGGQGLTSTVLHDINGPVGRAAQILTVRPHQSPNAV